MGQETADSDTKRLAEFVARAKRAKEYASQAGAKFWDAPGYNRELQLIWILAQDEAKAALADWGRAAAEVHRKRYY